MATPIENDPLIRQALEALRSKLQSDLRGEIIAASLAMEEYDYKDAMLAIQRVVQVAELINETSRRLGIREVDLLPIPKPTR